MSDWEVQRKKRVCVKNKKNNKNEKAERKDTNRLAETQDKCNTLELSTREMLNFLVHQALNLKGANHVGLELWVVDHVADLAKEQLPDSAIELGADFLGFVGHVQLWDLLLSVGLQQTSQHADEGGLSSAVLAQHDENLRVSEITRLDLQAEVAERLAHSRVGVAVVLLGNFLISLFHHPECQ